MLHGVLARMCQALGVPRFTAGTGGGPGGIG